MRDINSVEILEFAKFFTPISHTKGRIRVRVSPKIKEMSGNFSSESIINSINQIDGITDIRLNSLIGSLTIFYDNEIFPKRLWDDFLNQKNTEELSEFLNKKQKEIL